MAFERSIPSYDDFLDKLVGRMTPQEILALEFSEDEQTYLHDLIERNNAGTITTEEAAVLQRILQIERMMTVLKAKAYRSLHQS